MNAPLTDAEIAEARRMALAEAARKQAEERDDFETAGVLLDETMDEGDFVRSIVYRAVDEVVALRAENEALRRGEYICRKCGIRKDGENAENERGDF